MRGMGRWRQGRVIVVRRRERTTGDKAATLATARYSDAGQSEVEGIPSKTYRAGGAAAAVRTDTYHKDSFGGTVSTPPLLEWTLSELSAPDAGGFSVVGATDGRGVLAALRSRGVV